MRNYMLILFLYPVLVFGQGDSITVKVPMGLPTGIAPMGTRFMLLSEPSAIRYLKINASNDVVLRTAAEMLSDIGAQAAGSYQPLATNLTSIGALANGNGFLKNNGSGTFSYENPAGSGDLIAANNLSDVASASTSRTNLGLEIGVNVQAFNSNLSTIAGLTATTDNFIVSVSSAWASRTPAQVRTTLALVPGTNVQAWDADLDGWAGKTPYAGSLVITTGKTATINNTVTIAGTDGVTTTLPAVAGTVMLNTSTSGVGTSPTSSSTQTITHNLGRVPTIIRIYGYGTFTANAAATATTSSMGVFNSSGNFCVYQRYGAAITTTQAGLTSNTFCILLATGGGNFISGVIQNVTSTQFDISWTETGTATAQPYLWEAQPPEP